MPGDLPPLPFIEPGPYRHHKGGEYDVLGVVRHSETLEPMVLYRPQAGHTGWWVRPFAMFVEEVEHEGRRQPRFRCLGPAEPACTIEPRRAAHAAELYAVLRDPALYEFLDESPPASVDALAETIRRSEGGRSPDGREHWLNWIVRDGSGAVAGYVQATVGPDGVTNVAYVLGRPFQRRGLARAAVRRMLAQVTADHPGALFFVVAEAGHRASLALARALGFTEPPAEWARARLDGDGTVALWRAPTP